jgi:general L-amino acid transport system permease protein
VTATDALAEPLAPVPAPEPPSDDLTPSQWVRANLFSGPVNTVVTVVAGLAALYLVYRLARWAFVTSDWEIIRANLRLFMVGRFPDDELWRPWVSGYVLAAAMGLASGAVVTSAKEVADAEAGEDPAQAAEPEEDTGLWGLAHRFWPLAAAGLIVLSLTRTILPTLLTIVLVAVFIGARVLGARLPRGVRRWTWLIVVAGLVASLVIVTGFGGIGWEDWGGLHLNVAASVAGIALAFPLGLLLALGRRSTLPGLRVLSVGYIELLRAVPLVALLFVSRYMIGFLFPTQVEPPSYLVRAVIVITLFEAAYIAEIVRGGLQAVPKGQVEAAQAIGLSPTRVMRLVVLPQALRAVIPAMVGQFISLFKDTSLLSIVSFFEMLAVAEVATEQDRFRGQGGHVVTLVFVGLLFWAGCSTMARESRRLERRLGVGER